MATLKGTSVSGQVTVNTNNMWLTPSKLVLGRTNDSVYAYSVIGVTDGNLHLDSYDGKGLYLNYYQTTKANSKVYFNGDSYYIQNGWFNGTSQWSDAPAGFKKRTSSAGWTSAMDTFLNNEGNNTFLTGWQDNYGGDIAFKTNSSTGTLCCEIDGYFFQGCDRHGSSRVADLKDLESYLPLTGGNISGSIGIGTHISNNPGDTTWLTLTPYRHTGGPWYIRNVDTASDSWFQIKYGSSEIFKMKHDGHIQLYSSMDCYSIAGTHASFCSDTENIQPNYAAIEVREYNRGADTVSNIYAHAPRIGFHWGNRFWLNLLAINDELHLVNSTGDAYRTFRCGDIVPNGTVYVPNSYIWVQGGSDAGGNTNRLTTSAGMPGNMQYNQGRRGTQIYSNGIAFADPYNGNSNNDSAWIRHTETTTNSGSLEIAVGDDADNEYIYFRGYNTSNTIGWSAEVPHKNGTVAVVTNYTNGTLTING